MVTPRVTIDELPAQTLPEDSNQIIVQDSGVTKRMTLAALGGYTGSALLNHLNDVTDAHDASAISAAYSGPGVDGANVQVQLGQLSLLVGTGGGGGGGGGITTEDAVDAVATALTEGAGIDIAYDDTANTITVTNTAPAGATGPPGAAGQPGEPAGSLLSAFWMYSPTTAAAPAVGEIRTNDPITVVWVHETDLDGFNRAFSLSTPVVGNQILVRASNGTSMNLEITGTPADSGAYWAFPVTVISGTVTKGVRTQVSWITAPFTNEMAVDAVAASLVEGVGIDIVYNDAANQITITNTVAGGGGITTEDAVDAVAASLVEGSNIDIAYDDSANTITISSTGGGAGVTDGDKGDIVVSSGGAQWLFDPSVVTAAARSILDDASVAAILSTLGGQPLDSDLTAVAGLTTNGLINRTGTGTMATVTAPTGVVVGTTDSQTLTNKSVNLANNTLTGTTAQFNTALTDGDFATLAGTESLTNKTINGGLNTLTNIPQASVTGLTTALGTKVNNVSGVAGIWTGSQAAYDAISTKDATTLYVVT